MPSPAAAPSPSLPPLGTLFLRFPGNPVPVQSARFARNGRPYQPQEVLNWKRFIHVSARHQTSALRTHARPCVFDHGPLQVEIVYHFSLPKTARKAAKDAASLGVPVRKATRPDVTDNLNKGLVDALTGVVWPDDGIISDCIARKRFVSGAPYTTVEVRTVPEFGA